MKRSIYYLIIIYSILTFSCQILHKSGNNLSEENNAEENEAITEPTEVSLVKTIEIKDSPNFELFVTGVSAQSLENGMRRLDISLMGKNSSSEWYSYSIRGFFEGENCTWAIGQGFGDPVEKGNPILYTKEGYQYPAISDYNTSCGPRSTPDIPPGMIISGIGKDFSSIEPFGWVMFDIAESATPDIIEIQYDCGYGAIFGFVPCFETKTQKVDFDKEYSGSVPFDETYSPEFNYVGDIINVGELANIVIGNPDTINQSSITIPINITNLHKGYPIKLSSNISFSINLVNSNGELCSPTNAGDLLFDTIGPSQTWKGNVTFDFIHSGRYWLLGEIGVEEETSSGAVAKAFWITQFDILIP